MIDTSEKQLETLITEYLIEQNKYLKGSDSHYNANYCLDTHFLLGFLQDTQAESLSKLQKRFPTQWEDKLFKRIKDEIGKRGILHVLRNGVKEDVALFKLYYPKPPSEDNPRTVKLYEANRFSVTRQLHYSLKNRNSLDVVVFVNGLPVITMELKNNFTCQHYKDAIRQYKEDRDPTEPLFGFKRCLVHFAVDDEVAFMTTKLNGVKTTFLPFNKGYNDGAGNPVNPNGLKTHYLWEDILRKDSLAEIFEKYAQLIEEKDEDNPKAKPKEKLIFPRYHQLDVVRKLLHHAQQKGLGQRYLIQHSAGSGKSNSISWLAHQLVELYDVGHTQPIFDSIIIVTDRRVLDKQIRDNIKSFDQQSGVVQAIDKGSKQLREALESGKKIITTTIQKFPVIFQEVKGLSGKRFAIIIDEAHSSQGGNTASKLNYVLGSSDELPEGYDAEQYISDMAEKRLLAKNASYFAFTATPKNKTCELFGVQKADGTFHPFHLYSMKQAIEEEFILDVLRNYTTLKSYYNLGKKVEEDPVFKVSEAQKKLRRYVEQNEKAIENKAEIMIDHFETEVYRKRLINGQAKAMVVTSSILNAIQYYHAFCDYLKKRNLYEQMKPIVAFSGAKDYKGISYTEDSLNGFSSNDIPKTFKKNEYRFLIVAEKFQTGFDQPLLHTMYVDKKLADIQAVQTLSRLNRAYKPHKQETFVLDFANEADEIREAFQPYFQATILSESTDVNRLNDLQEDLEQSGVFTEFQVSQFTNLLMNPKASREQLDPVLDECKQVYDEDLDNDCKLCFYKDAKMYCRAYAFLAQIVEFRDEYKERLYWFLKYLGNKLRPPQEDINLEGLLESIELESYSIEQRPPVNIALLNQEGTIDPAQPKSALGVQEKPEDFLSNILNEFNRKWGAEFSDPDRMRQTIESFPQKVISDVLTLEAIQNSDADTGKITVDKKVEALMVEMLDDHTEFFKLYMDNGEFKAFLHRFVANEVKRKVSVVE